VKTKLAIVALALFLMWGIKRHYADAPVDDLHWMLGPTARLVTALTGTVFEWEAGAGYLSRERLFLIEKACAGINFLIAAFGMVTWTLLRRVESWASGAGVLLTSGIAAYSAAVVVNAGRIAVGMWLAARPLHGNWITVAQLHRVEGIAFYFGGLVVLYELVRRLDDRPQPVRRLAIPLVCYYVVTIGVPLANGAADTGAVFIEHALSVLFVPLAFIGIAKIGGRRMPNAARGETPIKVEV
jgi:exosortase K